MVNVLKQLFERDLDLLAKEIGAYKQESDLWIVDKGISNSGGNICLHLTGNLQHFIGHILGGSNYIRNRNAEFADKNIPINTLLADIETTKQVINNTLNQLTPEQLSTTYPVEVFGKPMTTTYFLTHLSTHLSYHLGQLNYHRRLLPNQ